ncbi:MAG: hypothetical protein ACNS60_06850 [Candidatus Cyclobacteriaceae bacterium M2_1C_046]
MNFNFNRLLPGIIIICLTTSCTDTEIGARVPVNISNADIPEKGQINTSIAIQATAQANNGCYEDLQISFNTTDSVHFLLKATGLFQTNGACPQVIVSKDTTIDFTPLRTGKYYFQINEYPFPVSFDTLEVK